MYAQVSTRLSRWSAARGLHLEPKDAGMMLVDISTALKERKELGDCWLAAERGKWWISEAGSDFTGIKLYLLKILLIAINPDYASLVFLKMKHTHCVSSDPSYPHPHTDPLLWARSSPYPLDTAAGKSIALGWLITDFSVDQNARPALTWLHPVAWHLTAAHIGSKNSLLSTFPVRFAQPGRAVLGRAVPGRGGVRPPGGAAAPHGAGPPGPASPGRQRRPVAPRDAVCVSLSSLR